MVQCSYADGGERNDEYVALWCSALLHRFPLLSPPARSTMTPVVYAGRISDAFCSRGNNELGSEL